MDYEKGSSKKVHNDRHNTENYLNTDQRNDDLLQSFGMLTGHRLLQKLQHILEYLDSGVQEIDPLGNLQVTPGRAVEGLEIRIGPKYFGGIQNGTNRVEIRPEEEELANLPHDFFMWHPNLSRFANNLWYVLGLLYRR